MSKKVVIIGGGLSSKHAAEVLLKKVKPAEITIIQANQFVEWPLAMPTCLVKHEMHGKAIAPNCDSYQVKGVKYRYAVAAGVDTSTNQVKLASGENVPYDALIVATGFKVPLIYPGVGVSLEERKAEVKKVSEAIKSAATLVIGGGGPVALEIAGEVRSAFPNKNVTVVAKSNVLPQWPEKRRALVEAALKRMNIQIATGSAPTEPDLKSGTLNLEKQQLSYGVYLPGFTQGPNTKFLEAAGILDDRGFLDVTETLQSRSCSNVFGVGVCNVNEPFIGMPKLEGQWNSVANNVACLLAGKPLKPHKESVPFMKLPPLVAIGDGATGYGFFDFDNLPPPLKCCCCCGLGGWPCCPPCWPCFACAGCGCCPCEVCGCASEGKGPAKFAEAMHFKSAGFHFKGIGEAPAQQSMN